MYCQSSEGRRCMSLHREYYTKLMLNVRISFQQFDQIANVVQIIAKWIS